MTLFTQGSIFCFILCRSSILLLQSFTTITITITVFFLKLRDAVEKFYRVIAVRLRRLYYVCQVLRCIIHVSLAVCVGFSLRHVQKLCSAITDALEPILRGSYASQRALYKFPLCGVIWCFAVCSEVGRNRIPPGRMNSMDTCGDCHRWVLS